VLLSDAYREEQDEESMEWELAQVRRAGNAADVLLQDTAPKTYEPTPIPPAIPVPVLDATIAKLTQKLTALTTSHAKNTAELIKMGEENASLEKQEAELKGQVENAEQRRAWFQSFKERVESVGDFLDEKVCLSLHQCIHRDSLPLTVPWLGETRRGARIAAEGEVRHNSKATR
jgi:GC-rich sequence DNA-binding factor